jgi:xanthine dehydrogenase YagR molybdenum-binding subunit
MSSKRADPVGKPLSRVDGRLKVTGQARYAAEWQVPGLAHAALVLSTIPRGTVTGIDASAAEISPGVLAVISHRNAPRVSLPQRAKAGVDPAVGDPLQPLQDDKVYYNGQPVAVVVADTFELAVQAAGLVRVRYREQRAVTEFAAAMADAFTPGRHKSSDRDTRKPADYHRGDADKALAEAPVKVRHTYAIPDENHNPMELHATIAAWAARS